MKLFAAMFFCSILINSSFGQSKLIVEERIKAIKKDTEEKLQAVETDSEVEQVARGIDNFIQDRCTERKVPPSLPILQDHADGFNITLNDKSELAHVKLSNLTVKYIQNDFKCVGSVKIKSAPLKLDRTFNLPIPHKLDLKAGYWSLRK